MLKMLTDLFMRNRWQKNNPAEKNRCFLREDSQNKRQEKRSLRVESLEDRALLSVTDIGFLDPVLDSYTPMGNGSFEINLENEANQVFMSDVNGDGKTDVIAVNTETQRIFTFFNSGTDNNFEDGKSTSIDGLNSLKAISVGDVSGDGIADLVVVEPYQTGVLPVYVYVGNDDGTFASNPISSQISLDGIFSDPGTYAVSSVKSELKNVSGTSSADLVIQIGAFSLESASTELVEKVVVFEGTGKATVDTAPFNSQGTELTAVKGTFAAVAQFDATSFVVSNDKSAGLFYFKDVSTPEGASWSFNYRSGDYSGVSIYWTVSPSNVSSTSGTTPLKNTLISGASWYDSVAKTQKNGLLVQNFTYSAASNEWTGVSSWVDLDIVMSSGSFGAVGLLDADKYVDVLIGNGGNYSVAQGAGMSSTGEASFDVLDAVQTQVNFHSSYVGTLGKDKSQQIFLVGEQGVWIRSASADTPKEMTQVASFDIAATKAVFGDFDHDGLTDIAVMGGQAGSTVFIYTQITSPSGDGSLFVKTRSYSSSFGTPLDMVVGRFSQTSVDELAVLYSGTGNTKSIAVYSQIGSDTTSAVMSFTLTSGKIANAITVYQNASGYDDLVYTESSSSKAQVSFLRNIISGSKRTFKYSSTETFDVGNTVSRAYPVAVVSADLNADGVNDLVVLNAGTGGNGHIRVVYMDEEGAGTVADHDVSFEIRSGKLSGLVVFDVDADGALDIVTSSYVENTDGTLYISTVYVYQGNLDDLGNYSYLTPEVNSSAAFSNGSIVATPVLSLSRKSIDSNGSQDLIILKGNDVALFMNKSEEGASLGSMKFVIRDASETKSTVQIADPTTQTGVRTWIDEWSHYWVEVWAASEGNAEIEGFNLSFNYDTNYFVPGKIEWGTAFESAGTVVTDGGTVSVRGMLSSSSSGQGINGQNTLLVRILMNPALETGVDISKMTEGFNSVDCGFTVAPETLTLTTARGDAPLETVSFIDETPLYPVMYDLKQDGVSNIFDFLKFVTYFGKDVASSTDPLIDFADFTRDGTVNIFDFLRFAPTFAMEGSNLTNSFYDSNSKVSFYVADPATLIKTSSANLPETGTETFLASALPENTSMPTVSAISVAENSLLLPNAYQIRSGALDFSTVLTGVSFTNGMSVSEAVDFIDLTGCSGLTGVNVLPSLLDEISSGIQSVDDLLSASALPTVKNRSLLTPVDSVLSTWNFDASKGSQNQNQEDEAQDDFDLILL